MKRRDAWCLKRDASCPPGGGRDAGPREGASAGGPRSFPRTAFSHWKVDVKFTLTAPGCGMGPILQTEVRDKVLAVPGVQEAAIEVVFDPPWNQSMMSDAAKLQLGIM